MHQISTEFSVKILYNRVWNLKHFLQTSLRCSMFLWNVSRYGEIQASDFARCSFNQIIMAIPALSLFRRWHSHFFSPPIHLALYWTSHFDVEEIAGFAIWIERIHRLLFRCSVDTIPYHCITWNSRRFDWHQPKIPLDSGISSASDFP